MGMSVGVTLVGKVTVYLPQFGEEYVFTLPRYSIALSSRHCLFAPFLRLSDAFVRSFGHPRVEHSGLLGSVFHFFGEGWDGDSYAVFIGYGRC